MMQSIDKALVAFIFFVLIVFPVQAVDKTGKNDSPIPVELNIGNNRFGLQLLLNKQLEENSRFAFLSVTSFESAYDNNINNLDFMNNSLLTYDVYRGFGITTGLSVNVKTALTPVIGLKYIFANRDILVVVAPAYHLTRNNNIEALSVLEYKPAITEDLNLYSRIQSLYNYNISQNQHERSYIQLRLGLGIKKYQFGLASNLDYYGKNLIFKNNIGAFLRVNL